mmetsp:Transcript_71931/g.192086  ORF Transcript_71931/g.192086 Transcript_71931/m.192086 type:complete len:327 (+) Transcript_71931:652-1632(+)
MEAFHVSEVSGARLSAGGRGSPPHIQKVRPLAAAAHDQDRPPQTGAVDGDDPVGAGDARHELLHPHLRGAVPGAALGLLLGPDVADDPDHLLRALRRVLPGDPARPLRGERGHDLRLGAAVRHHGQRAPRRFHQHPGAEDAVRAGGGRAQAQGARVGVPHHPVLVARQTGTAVPRRGGRRPLRGQHLAESLHEALLGARRARGVPAAGAGLPGGQRPGGRGGGAAAGAAAGARGPAPDPGETARAGGGPARGVPRGHGGHPESRGRPRQGRRAHAAATTSTSLQPQPPSPATAAASTSTTTPSAPRAAAAAAASAAAAAAARPAAL